MDVRQVRKVYQRDTQEITVLDGISLQVPEGEFVALMGPSGSGKTTLLNLIAGIDRPTSGKVIVAGTDVGAALRERARQVAQPQRRVHLPVLQPDPGAVGGRERRAAAAADQPLARSERRERALTALKVVGLADRSEHYPRQLSGGQEQRVAIARAIVADPKVLVADEPTGDLDAKSAEEILALMETLNREFKKTIVMVTHDPRAAAARPRPAPPRKGRARQLSWRLTMKFLPFILKHLRRNWIRTLLHGARHGRLHLPVLHAADRAAPRSTACWTAPARTA